MLACELFACEWKGWGRGGEGKGKGKGKSHDPIG